MKILLAEDDRLLGEAIEAGLSYEGMSVDWFKDGTSAQAALELSVYDGAILDICMPGQSGIELLKRMRKDGSDMPVLMLTALGTVADRVTGLDSGADDYLVKPFDMDELQARLRALVRRSKGRTEPRIRYLDITITPDSKIVEKAGQAIDLSRQEYLVLLKLIESQGRYFSQQELINHLYSWSQDIGSNTIQVHIHYLRKKLGKSLIKNKRGFGYIIEKQE
jgi:two-component system response regulator QseB